MIDCFQVEPYFAFAWFITWFAHHVGGLDDASRLFDVFLCSHPLFSLYVSGAIVLASRSIILKQECEFGTMHDTLSKLVNDVSWDQAIVDGLQLIERFSPGVLLTHATDQHISM
ncbi:unnamed protein product [Albugo candida]|uniref:Rab-GAP TBC domain-containing protein n=1 Tax=Albugo candida TaxID=65357 RepID=A0A024FY82_9STRA|nr:unnamed protein product [Albugo candida]|eukprot:CCI39451.1 unnamed protein product [Albugo candida]